MSAIPPIAYDSVMLWAACSLGFFGFIWSEEFILICGHSCPLNPSDIKVDCHRDPFFLAVTLSSSKTDPFGTDVTLSEGAVALVY